MMASRATNSGVRGGLLLAIGLLSLALSFASFSLVTLVLLPPTVLLGLAAAKSLTASEGAFANSLPAVGAGLLIVAWVGLGFFILFALEDDEPRCWESSYLSEESPDQDTGRDGGKAYPVTVRTCTSDITTNTEATMSSGAIAVAFLGMLFVLRMRWSAGQEGLG